MPTPCITTQHYHSPCGSLLLGSYDGRLCLCDWLQGRNRARVDASLQRRLRAPMAAGDSPALRQAAAELDTYFAGQGHTFQVPLLFVGSAFQKAVWHELRHIPCGSTISYGALARRLGKPSAARATANAVGANPLSLFVPCHRVIGSGGSLTGYNGGLDIKRFLLERERPLPLWAEK